MSAAGKRLTAGLCAALCALCVPAVAADLHTAHYDLHIEGLGANQVGAMLEQLHSQLRMYFGTEPKGRLSLALYATRDEWVTALRADGQYVPPQAGGYYAPQTHKAYVWAQPTEYFTRQVVLHEATHQFHWLTATGNASPSAKWYYEGLAEYFGMHNWDGKHLQTGVIPAITLEDYPGAALKAYNEVAGDLMRMCSRGGRPGDWALVHFLLKKHRAQFRSLATKLDARQGASSAWNEIFGDSQADLSREFGDWLRSHAQPWRVVWTGWQQRGRALESRSSTMSMAVLKQTPRSLRVRIEPASAGATPGLVFGYRSASDFYLFQALPNGKLRVVRREGNGWRSVPLGDAGPVKDCSVLSVTQDDGSTTLWASRKKIATVTTTGQVGLNVQSGGATFQPF